MSEQYTVCDANSAEITSKAMDAVSTIVSLSSWTLAVLGIVLALVSVVGGLIIYKGCVVAAKKAAEKKFDNHCQTSEFLEKIERMITSAVDAKFQSGMVPYVHPDARQSTDSNTFPDANDES